VSVSAHSGRMTSKPEADFPIADDRPTSILGKQLLDARRKDPQVQLWPEVAGDIIGEDYYRAADFKNAIEVFKLNLLAYPDSADAHSNLADAYLADGEMDLARQYAEKALALLDRHKAPASSWSDTEERRGEIRRDIESTLARASEESEH
jgi:tetratricopeptide (TPR) repeat protein